MPFSPGELSKSDADKLSRMERMLEGLSRMTATAPLSINKSGSNPIISLGQQNIPLLAEVISVSGTTYTVKRKTRNSSNAVVDLTPVEQIQNVVTQDGSVLAVGDLVNVQSIPDWPLPVQFWWATRAGTSGGNVSSNCSGLIGLIRSGSCFTLSITANTPGSCSCVEDQETAMTWSEEDEAMVGADYIYGCPPGVVTSECPDGAPMKYRVIVAGFTGAAECTDLNGTWTLTWVSGNTWSGTLLGQTTTLVIASGVATLTLVESGTIYDVSVSDCCDDLVLGQADAGSCDTPPATLTAEPVTSCGLGTPYTAYLDLCETDCDGPQPRLRLVPATGSGAATITFSRSGCVAGGGMFSTSNPIFCTGTLEECGENSVTASVACRSCSISTTCEDEEVTIPVVLCMTYSGMYTGGDDAYLSIVWTGGLTWSGTFLAAGSVNITVEMTWIPASCYWQFNISGTGFTGCSNPQATSFTEGPTSPPDPVPVSGNISFAPIPCVPNFDGALFYGFTISDGNLGCPAPPPSDVSFNCLENGTCIDPGDGSGEYPTEAACLADCSGGIPAGDNCNSCGLLGQAAELVIPDGPDSGTYSSTGTYAVWTAVTGGTAINFNVSGPDSVIALCLASSGDILISNLSGATYGTTSCGVSTVMTFPGASFGATGFVTVTTPP